MAWRQIAPGVFEGFTREAIVSQRGGDVSEGFTREAISQCGGDVSISDEVERRVRLSNIPRESMTTHRLETWEHRVDGGEQWWPKIKAYAGREYQHPFLTLAGPRGTGKTHIALAVGWEWLRLGAGVLYYHTEDLLDALRRGYSLSHQGTTDVYDLTLEFMRQANLLIIDDLGAHNETDWAVVKLDQIVDYRYERKRPLIVTTNLALNRLPESIADRLSEGLIVHLTGESYRKRKRAAVKE